MTPALAIEISGRMQSLLNHHSNTVVIDSDISDLMNGVFDGRLCCLMVRRGGYLVLLYLPRHKVQFLFDCYAT